MARPRRRRRAGPAGRGALRAGVARARRSRRSAGDELLTMSRAEERAGLADRRGRRPAPGRALARRRCCRRRCCATCRTAGGWSAVLNTTGRARLLACAACATIARCEVCDAAVAQPDEHALRCAALRDRAAGGVLACGAGRFRAAAARRGPPARRAARRSPAPRSVGGDGGDRRAAAARGPGVRRHRGRAPPGRRRPTSSPSSTSTASCSRPRYRAAEQAFGLLARAARLVGGRAGGGRLLVQTRLPAPRGARGRAAWPTPAGWPRSSSSRRAWPSASRRPPPSGRPVSGPAGGRRSRRGASVTRLGVERARPGRRHAGSLPAPPTTRRSCATPLARHALGRRRAGVRVEVDPLRDLSGMAPSGPGPAAHLVQAMAAAVATLSEPTRPSIGQVGDRVARRQARPCDSPWSSWPTTRHTSAAERELVQRHGAVGQLDADHLVAGGPGRGDRLAAVVDRRCQVR